MPLFYLLHQALAFGIGLLLGALNVFLKDVKEVGTAVLMVWFWATPIVWVRGVVPETVMHIVAILNPAYWFVSFYHSVTAFGEAQDAVLIWRLAALAALVVGCAVFALRYHERVIRNCL